MTMKFKKIMIVSMLLLSIIMIGAVSASDDIADDTVSLDEDNNDEISIEENEDEISAQDSEVLEKTNEETLSASRTYDIYDFNTLQAALTSEDYDQVTLNIRADLKLTSDTEVSESIAKVTINGNGKTVNGDNKYQFLYLESSTLVLSNLKMVNCVGRFGGAINAGGDYNSITNCVFSNCEASYDAGNMIEIYGYTVYMVGGAIFNSGASGQISNNVFENNKAITRSQYLKPSNQELRGGAIYNQGDDTTISNNVFKGNYANYDKIICKGGAIYNYGDNIKMTGNTFENSNADYGGAIYNEGYYCTISNNKFNYNHADTRGSAIHNMGKYTTIESNTFKLNKIGGTENDVIVTSKSDTALSNNKFTSISSTSKGTVTNTGEGVTIKNNVFDDRHNTIMTVTQNVGYGDYIVISVKDDQGAPVSGAKVNVNIGKSKTYTTDKNGQIKISTDNLKLKKYGLKASFAGNGGNLGSSVNVKVTVKKGTPKIVAKNKKFKKSASKKYQIKITSKTGKAIKKMKVTLKINGKSYKATTNKKGKVTFNLKINKKGKFKGKIKTKGNKLYKNSSKKVKITVK